MFPFILFGMWIFLLSLSFYPRWQEYESMQASLMGFSLTARQLAADWAIMLNIASQPGTPLEQIHIFVLTHILRRPIIVYGVKYVKSFRGEALGLARFEGEPFCIILLVLCICSAS